MSIKCHSALCLRGEQLLLCLSQEGGKMSDKGRMRFVDIEKALDRVPRKVLEWTMRKKGTPEVLVGSVMSQLSSVSMREERQESVLNGA